MVGAGPMIWERLAMGSRPNTHHHDRLRETREDEWCCWAEANADRFAKVRETLRVVPMNAARLWPRGIGHDRYKAIR